MAETAEDTERRNQKWARRGSLVLLLSGAGAAVFPSASGCKGRQDSLRNCDPYALFQSSCDGAVCHGAENPRANLDLVSPGVDQRLFHVLGTSDCDERPLVFPGKPEDSLLLIKVVDDEPFCGSQMPPGKSLSDDEIACLTHYIQEAGTDTDVADCETCGGILCVDFERDPMHCGGCDQPCADGQICGGSECINPCQPDETLCGSSCVLIDSNNSHCGTCGHRCGPGSSCQMGVCACDPTSDGAGGAGGMTGGPMSEVSFQNDLLPILDNSCSGSECHTEMDRQAPLGLGAANAYGNLVGIAAEECGGKDYVVPGSPDQSYLIDKLMGGTLCAGDQMPLGEDPLPTAGVRAFVDWICAGAPDN